MRVRLIAVTLVTVSAGLMAACGSTSSGSPAQSTVAVNPTSYATTPPAAVEQQQTTLAPGQVAGEQQYTLVTGDIGIYIEQKCGVSWSTIAEYNLFPNGISQILNVGDVIKIPAGGIQGCTGTSGNSATTSVPGITSAPTNPPGTTIPGGQSNCDEGSYTVEDGDTLSGIASKVGTTLARLLEANGWTDTNQLIYQGLKIKIPAKEDC